MTGEPREENLEREGDYHYSVVYGGESAQERSARAYRHSRDEIFRSRAELDLSVYRFIEATVGAMAPIGWYVALIGEKPPRALERRLKRELASGERVELAEDTLEKLRERRRAASERGGWVEGSYPRPGEAGFGEPRL